jgi:hypothetical protein
MDDRVLQDSIATAIGITETAHRAGIPQVSISNRSSAPAERFLSVETVMDVARAILWPNGGGEKPDRR